MRPCWGCVSDIDLCRSSITSVSASISIETLHTLPLTLSSTSRHTGAKFVICLSNFHHEPGTDYLMLMFWCRQQINICVGHLSHQHKCGLCPDTVISLAGRARGRAVRLTGTLSRTWGDVRCGAHTSHLTPHTLLSLHSEDNLSAQQVSSLLPGVESPTWGWAVRSGGPGRPGEFWSDVCLPDGEWLCDGQCRDCYYQTQPTTDTTITGSGPQSTACQHYLLGLYWEGRLVWLQLYHWDEFENVK